MFFCFLCGLGLLTGSAYVAVRDKHSPEAMVIDGICAIGFGAIGAVMTIPFLLELFA